jgi:hypothetical protein
LLQIFALLLQIVALLFGIKCTRKPTNHSLSNIYMYIISVVKARTENLKSTRIPRL